MQCEVWSVECEDFASSLAEKIKRLSREGHGRDRLSLNYRSFMFGKLPPPACPGLCYIVFIIHTVSPRMYMDIFIHMDHVCICYMIDYDCILIVDLKFNFHASQTR